MERIQIHRLLFPVANLVIVKPLSRGGYLDLVFGEDSAFGRDGTIFELCHEIYVSRLDAKGMLRSKLSIALLVISALSAVGQTSNQVAILSSTTNKLSDGSLMRVEAVSYGIVHRISDSSSFGKGACFFKSASPTIMFITSREAPAHAYLRNLWTQAEALDASGHWFPLRRRTDPRPVTVGLGSPAGFEGIPPRQMEEIWEFPSCPDPSSSLRVRIEPTDIFGRVEETNSGDVEFQLPNDREWREQSEKKEMSSFNQQDWLNCELWRAAYQDEADYVKELTSQGADPNSTDSTGMSALAIACQDGHTTVIRYLLDHGADVNGHCKGCITDRTPLIAAASMQGQLEILRLLISHGANVNARGEDGWTALIWAAGMAMSKV